MKMIVGLGNPGKEYENTRHNMGFIVIDNYANNNGIAFKNKFNGLFAKVFRNGEYFILLKPLSYMNLSGTVIRDFSSYFKIKPEDILVIHDDIDLPVGKIKIKSKGSSAGHNGIKNIIENLKSEEFARFKIGIGRDDNIRIKDYVTGHLDNNDLDKIDKICSFSSNIINDFIDYDIQRIMSKYNGEDYEIK